MNDDVSMFTAADMTTAAAQGFRDGEKSAGTDNKALADRLDSAWRKLYGDGDEHCVCDVIGEAVLALREPAALTATPSAQADKARGEVYGYVAGGSFISADRWIAGTPPKNWTPVYTAPQPQGNAIDRERSTPRREAAVRLVLAEGWNWDGTAWTREPQGDASPEVRDREADRRRFSDPAFNRWMDEGISDAGHTVWDAVGDVQSAWAGWDARQFAGDAVLIAECCGREECGGECGNEWRGMGMYRRPADDATPQARPEGYDDGSGRIRDWREPAPTVDGGAVYQYRSPSVAVWVDISKYQFDLRSQHDEGVVRVLYRHPAPQADVARLRAGLAELIKASPHSELDHDYQKDVDHCIACRRLKRLKALVVDTAQQGAANGQE